MSNQPASVPSSDGPDSDRPDSGGPGSRGCEGAGPRVLRVRLDPTGEARVDLAEFAPAEPAVRELARWGGTALAATWLFEHVEARPAPLVIAVGDAVRRGAPTAARACVASRSPLSGRFGDGQVGGDLGRHLAGLCDALVVEGSVDKPLGACVHALVVEPGPAGGAPTARVVRDPALAGLDSLAVGRALAARWPGAATLAIGPAGERELPVASLVAGGDPPHFAGRGGLGAVLGRTGLKAIVVLPAAANSERAVADRDDELVALLTRSPRLLARSAGGTLELFDDLAARAGAGPERDGARRVSEQIAGKAGKRHGCKGCPTPCGFEFESRRGPKGARFGAARALGLELGLEDFDDALELLDACDRVGVDAKEVGSGLAILAAAERGSALRGNRPALLAEIEALAAGEVGSNELGLGARALARSLGLEERLEGAWLESGRGPASLLGQTVSARGSDPMRAFPFLASDTADLELARALLDPVPLEPAALDPALPDGKGRLVWWHEHLALALDATGFCAFSAAALLADGTASLEELAGRLLPPSARAGPSPGRALLAAGEQLARLLALLNRRYGARGVAPASPGLVRPGLWDEYAALRGLDRAGAPTAALEQAFLARRAADARGLLAALPARAGQPDGSDAAHGGSSRTRPGAVLLRSSGPLARALGRERSLELELPAALREVLAAAARAGGAQAEELLGPGRPAPVVYRDGSRLGPEDAVRDGDALDLLLVISGGGR